MDQIAPIKSYEKWAETRQSTISTQKGYQLGYLYYLFNPLVSDEVFFRTLTSLQVPKRYSSIWYQYGFFSGFIETKNRSGDMSPEEVKEMASKFAQAAAKAEKLTAPKPFVKVDTLIELDAIFCIERIIKKTFKRGGDKWVVSIRIDKTLSKKIDNLDYRCAFTLTQKPNSRRDIFLEDLSTCCPHHSISVDKTELESGDTFINLVERKEEDCPCGVKAQEEEEEFEEEEEEDPFLKDDEFFQGEEEEEEDKTPRTKTVKTQGNPNTSKGVDFSARVKDKTRK